MRVYITKARQSGRKTVKSEADQFGGKVHVFFLAVKDSWSRHIRLSWNETLRKRLENAATAYRAHLSEREGFALRATHFHALIRNSEPHKNETVINHRAVPFRFSNLPAMKLNKFQVNGKWLPNRNKANRSKKSVCVIEAWSSKLISLIDVAVGNFVFCSSSEATI